MQVLAVANSKGGTGKTTVSVSVAVGLALRGKRVLLVDLDTHGSSTKWLLKGAPLGKAGAYDAVLGRPFEAEDATPAPGREGLWMLPSTPAMAHAAVELAADAGSEQLLREALNRVRKSFDVVVLDCAGSLDRTVLSALVAADGMIAPVLSDYLALEGLAKIDETLQRARTRLRARVALLGYVHFGVDARHCIAQETREALNGTGHLMPVEVRTSVSATALPGIYQTSWDKGADPRGAEDYEALLDEVCERMAALPKRRVG